MRSSVGVGGAPTAASVTGVQPVTRAQRKYPGSAGLNPRPPREHPAGAGNRTHMASLEGRGGDQGADLC